MRADRAGVGGSETAVSTLEWGVRWRGVQWPNGRTQTCDTEQEAHDLTRRAKASNLPAWMDAEVVWREVGPWQTA